MCVGGYVIWLVVWCLCVWVVFFFFFQAEDGIRDRDVTGVQTCALPIYRDRRRDRGHPRRAVLPGRPGHGLGPARLRGARARGVGRARNDRRLARLSSRPRLRAARGQARGAGRPDRAPRMKDVLTLALPKGRLLDPALALLRDLGVEGIDGDSRRLIFTDPKRELRVLFRKPADVPAYVVYGAG